MDNTEVYAIVLGIAEVLFATWLVGKHSDSFEEGIQSVIVVTVPLGLQLPLFGRVLGWW